MTHRQKEVETGWRCKTPWNVGGWGRGCLQSNVDKPSDLPVTFDPQPVPYIAGAIDTELQAGNQALFGSVSFKTFDWSLAQANKVGDRIWTIDRVKCILGFNYDIDC